MQANLLQEQLLDANDDIHEKMSSRPFLVGAAIPLLELCCDNLVNKYEHSGVELFDPRYLLRTLSDERCIARNTDFVEITNAKGEVPAVFSGATELFFLSSALLRISLFPAIYARDEYHRRYKSALGELSALAASKESAENVPEVLKKIAGGALGQEACLDDRDLLNTVVSFSILQLQYLADLSTSRNAKSKKWLAVEPEHFAKLPAQFIARFQVCLTPRQAEQAAEFSTKLLGSEVILLVQVQVELIRIFNAFIRAGVQREAARQRRKRHSRSHHSRGEEEGVVIDNRWLNIYTSLDKKDHGAVVFSSPFVCEHLGPTLVQSFTAMDAVEGLDVEKENLFHKNIVISELTDLLQRLWHHPNGFFRRSVALLNDEVLAGFVRAIVAAIGIATDSAYQSILDIRDILESNTNRGSVGMREKQRISSCYERLAQFLGEFRRLLLLLACLSDDKKIAAICGDGGPVSHNLGTMIVFLMDKFTAFDGTTNQEVDFRRALVGTGVNGGNPGSAGGGDSSNIEVLMEARTFAKKEFGLDVSLIAHLLMSLAARWTLAAMNEGDLRNA